jgi:ABC-type transporter Mla subunit MlaD
MSDWFQAILALCAVAITAAVVPLLVRLRRTAQRAETLLGVAERELSPLVAELHGLADALRDTVRELQQELKRVGAIADHVADVAGGIARIVNALSALTKAGEVVALVAGLRKGVDVFVQRFRRRD